MKIENQVNRIINPLSGQDQKQKEVSGSDFQTLLKNRLQKASASTALTSSQEVNSAQSINPELRLESLSTSEATINTLDSYKNSLANLNFKGPQLESYIDDLEEKTLALQDLKGDLPAGDPLRGLVDQVAAISYVETVKYRRGDY
ncbi:MAG: hypothetical protein ACQES8_02710 [Thermodesulfobacteriota bacterium]